MNKTIINNWLKDAGIFNENTYGETIIVLLISVTGYHFLGNNFDDGLVSNLSKGFMWCFTFMMLAALSQVIIRLIPTPRKLLQNSTLKYQRQLDHINNTEKRRILNEYLHVHAAPTRTATSVAITFLGCFILFGTFIIQVWVNNYIIIWQPSWLESLIRWERSQNTLDWFIDSSISRYYISLQDFAYSPYGESLNLLQYYRAFMFIPVLFCVVLLLWRLNTEVKSKLSILNFCTTFLLAQTALFALLSSPELLLHPNKQLLGVFSSGDSTLLSIIWIENFSINNLIILAIFFVMKISIDTIYHYYSRSKYIINRD